MGLLRSLAVAAFACLVLMTGLHQLEPPPTPLLVTNNAAPAPMMLPVPMVKKGSAAIPLLRCGSYVGSAFRVSPHKLVTAAHMAALAPCAVDGRPVRVTYGAPTADYAELADSGTGPFLNVDCRGFVAGHRYTALGHARGVAEVIAVELLALDREVGGYQLLAGIFTTIPGQSGGVIVDTETRAAVGLVNGSNFEAGVSVSVPLSRTRLCLPQQKQAAPNLAAARVPSASFGLPAGTAR